jgi:hypothetical protein
MADTPMTVLETARFLKDVKPLMSDSEREELVVFVGANPEAGEIIPETGGVRKIRWPGEANAAARGRSTTTTTNDYRYSCLRPMEKTRRRI